MVCGSSKRWKEEQCWSWSLQPCFAGPEWDRKTHKALPVLWWDVDSLVLALSACSGHMVCAAARCTQVSLASARLD